MVFLSSPVISIFLQPLIGRLSDTNTSCLGKRRPFLLVFVAGLTLGCLLQIFASSLPSYVAHIVVIFVGDNSTMLLTLHPHTSLSHLPLLCFLSRLVTPPSRMSRLFLRRHLL